MTRPLVVDIDGTMTRPDRSIEGRVLDELHGWDAPVVLATGKAFPYPVALCDFIGIPVAVVAENGGVVCAGDAVEIHGDREAAARVAAALEAEGFDLGWDDADLVNRWRETELATGRHIPRDTLDEIAGEHGLDVVDSGFAYHVKSPAVSKGRGLEAVAGLLGTAAGAFAAVGDSENDVATFEVAGVSYAVANADEPARAAADHVTAGANADGLLEALGEIGG